MKHIAAFCFATTTLIFLSFLKPLNNISEPSTDFSILLLYVQLHCIKSPLVEEIDKCRDALYKLPKDSSGNNSTKTAFAATSKKNFIGNAPYKISETVDCQAWIDKLPGNCINLTQVENFSAIDSVKYVSYARPTVNTVKPWKDVTYVAEEYPGCEYPNACTEDQSVLFYHVYYPHDYPYSTCTTWPPCVILFPPGGYSDCNNIDGATDCLQVARWLARHGNVVFVCEYRRGRLLSDKLINGVHFTTAQQFLAYYRAFQDARGAIRSIIKRNGVAGTPYKFDETNIFLGGFSAGAGCALNAAYYDQAMLDSIDGGAAHDKLGNLDGDYYYGEPTINYRIKLRGVLNAWGNAFLSLAGITDPATYFANSLRTPLISFHGAQDQVVAPYDQQAVYFPGVPQDPSSKTDYDPLHTGVVVNPETRCLPGNAIYALSYSTINDIDAGRFGSKKMYCFLKSLTYTELYVDLDMHHGVQIVSDNFGNTGFTIIEQTYDYIAQRVGTFFQAILWDESHPGFLNTLSSSNRLFVDCVNNRTDCQTVNPICPNDDPNFCN